jgi:hypothetical protein
MHLPPWLIAVITIGAVVFLLVVGIVLAVYITRRRATNAGNQAGNVPLHNIRYQGDEIRNSQQVRQISGIANPRYEETTCQNQPIQSPHFVYHPQEF